MNETHPDLAALLRGELSNAAAVAAAEHTRGCPTCRAGLVDDALGHGMLNGARRTLGGSDGEATYADAGLPLALRREITRASPLRRTLRVAAAAAVVALAVAAAGLGLGVRISDADPVEPSVEQTARLEPVDGNASGRVSMGTSHHVTRMELATRALPRAPKGEFYYAWLFDPRTNKMLPLGQVTPGRVATFEIPESLVAAYSAIDVSLEADDGDPAHSVTSVLRATYGDEAGDPS